MTSFVAELKKQHDDFLKKQIKQRKARRVETSPLRNDDFYYTSS